MTQGFLVLARNTPEVNYVDQAYALALSIKFSQKTVKNISIVTDDPVPDHYRKVFDQVIPIANDTEDTRYQTEVRWRLFHVSPYEETIVLDTDMLLMKDVSSWWEQCKDYDLKFCTRIKNYKQEPVVDLVHRRAFIDNALPSPYFALHYFKQRDVPLAFYKQLKYVVRNWKEVSNAYTPKTAQDYPSMDLAAAIAIEMLDLQHVVDTVCPLEFVHMKPAIQGWRPTPPSWQLVVPPVINSKGELLIGNFKQPALFHYVEKDFLNLSIINQLEELVNVRNV